MSKSHRAQRGQARTKRPERAQVEMQLLSLDQWLDAEPCHDLFAWTQRWPRTSWTLAYQGNLHEISPADMEIILAGMQNLAPPARLV